MLDDRSKRDRNDSEDSRDKKSCIKVAACEDTEDGILVMYGKSYPSSILDIIDACLREQLEVCITADAVEEVRSFLCAEVNKLTGTESEDYADEASSENTEEDRDDLDHALAPDVADDDDEDRDDRNDPVRGAAVDSCS